MNYKLPDFSQLAPALLAALPAALAIIAAAIALNFLIGRGFLYFARKSHLTPEEVAPAHRLVKWTVNVVALVLVFGAFGLNLGGLWGILSTLFALIAIGFVAVWSVLSNTLCTVIILVFRPFAIGDEIQFAGEPVKGRVIDLNFIFTTIEAEDGAVMQIPNNLFFQKVLWRRQHGHHVTLSEQLRSKKSHRLDPSSVPETVNAK